MSGPEQVHYCGHCGFYHAGQCPRIKAIEYNPDGTVRRVEYHDPQVAGTYITSFHTSRVDE